MSPLTIILLLFYALLLAAALLVWFALPGRRGEERAPARPKAPKGEETRITVAPRPPEPQPAHQPVADPRLTNPRPVTSYPANGATTNNAATNNATRGAWAKGEVAGEARAENKRGVKSKDKGRAGHEDDPFERFIRSRRDDLDL